MVIMEAQQRRRYERELVNAQEAERTARRQLQEVNSTLEARIAQQVAAQLEERETAVVREQFTPCWGMTCAFPDLRTAGRRTARSR
jgi:sigma-B regulation protein RsbU (phosphoserine phosphatase)